MNTHLDVFSLIADIHQVADAIRCRMLVPVLNHLLQVLLLTHHTKRILGSLSGRQTGLITRKV